jgi:hypothetical protein
VRDVLQAEPGLATDLLPQAPPPALAPLVSPPLTQWQAQGLDLILEGFLLHHARGRHLRPREPGGAVLAGDYCYAQGLIRVADSGDLFHIRALADLIALGSALVAAGERQDLIALWRASVAAMASRGGPDETELAAAHREAVEDLRQGRAGASLHVLAGRPAPTPALEEAFA